MAARIDAFTPKLQPSKFDPFLDGQKWRLRVPDDGQSLATLRRSLYRRGKLLGLRVHVRLYKQAQAVEVQAHIRMGWPARIAAQVVRS